METIKNQIPQINHTKPLNYFFVILLNGFLFEFSFLRFDSDFTFALANWILALLMKKCFEIVPFKQLNILNNICPVLAEEPYGNVLSTFYA